MAGFSARRGRAIGRESWPPEYDCRSYKTAARQGARDEAAGCRLPLNDPRGAFPPKPVCASS